ncbi:hypothetical protein JCM5350_005212 [Sporobolomyces pararoseus]
MLTAEGRANTSIKNLLAYWHVSARQTAVYAQLLIKLGAVAAADWIDALLPRPLEQCHFTGDGPLPLPPSSLIDSLGPAATTVAPLNTLPGTALPDSFSSRVVEPNPEDIAAIEPEKDHLRYSTKQSLYDTPNLYTLPSRVTLGLARFPSGYSKSRIAKLFHQRGVACRVLLLKTDTKETYAFVDVEYGSASTIIESLDGLEIENRKLRCFESTDLDESVLSRLGINQEDKPKHLILPPKNKQLSVEKDPSPIQPSEKKTKVFILLIFDLDLLTPRSRFKHITYLKLVIRQFPHDEHAVAIITFDTNAVEELVRTAQEFRKQYKRPVLKLSWTIEEIIEGWKVDVYDERAEKRLADLLRSGIKRPRAEGDLAATEGDTGKAHGEVVNYHPRKRGRGKKSKLETSPASSAVRPPPPSPLPPLHYPLSHSTSFHPPPLPSSPPSPPPYSASLSYRSTLLSPDPLKSRSFDESRRLHPSLLSAPTRSFEEQEEDLIKSIDYSSG